MLVNEIKTALSPKFDTAKSFYNKAELKQIEVDGGEKVYLLYSYKSLVCGIIEETNGLKWLYLNTKIKKELLTSQTTLRHIKEFYKQFFKDETITKKELLKKATLKTLDFIMVHETNEKIQTEFEDWNGYNIATSPETKAFFKNFKGYRERKTNDKQGLYLKTSSVYGFSNYYYYYI